MNSEPNNIRKYRQQNGLSQSELARLLRLSSYAMIGRYESGATEVPDKRLKEMAEIFHVSPEELLGSMPNTPSFTGKGEYIRYYRKLSGMTMKDLADKMGIDYTTMSKYERNTLPVPQKRMDQIIDILGITDEDTSNQTSPKTLLTFQDFPPEDEDLDHPTVDYDQTSANQRGFGFLFPHIALSVILNEYINIDKEVTILPLLGNSSQYLVIKYKYKANEDIRIFYQFVYLHFDKETPSSRYERAIKEFIEEFRNRTDVIDSDRLCIVLPDFSITRENLNALVYNNSPSLLTVKNRTSIMLIDESIAEIGKIYHAPKRESIMSITEE